MCFVPRNNSLTDLEKEQGWALLLMLLVSVQDWQVLGREDVPERTVGKLRMAAYEE